MVARSKESQIAKGEEHPLPPPQYPTGSYQTNPYPPSGGYPYPSYPPGGYQTSPYPGSYPPPDYGYGYGSYPTPPDSYSKPSGYYKPSHGPSRGYLETPTPEYLVGWIAAEIKEYSGVKPTTIIRTDEEWAICIYWSLHGVLAPLVCGEWCVHAFFESMGPGPELELPDDKDEVRIPLDPCGDGKYKYEFHIPKGKVKAEHCGTPYKLVVSVTYYDSCDRPGPMAGFVELPMLQFYDPGQVKGHHNHQPQTPSMPQTPQFPGLP